MKSFLTALMVVCSVLLVSCSSNTPTGAVEKAFDALVSEDFETYARSFYVEDKSDPERVEKDIQDLVNMMKRNSGDKLESYKILGEETSKTGKWVCVSYQLKYVNGKTTDSEFYLTKDSDGSWKIQMFGSKQLMDE